MKRFFFISSSQTLFLVLLFFVALQSFSQQQVVKVVNGQSGLPLENVLVLDPNQNLLGQTNRNGIALIPKPKANATIVFRLFGFELYAVTAEDLELNIYIVKMYPTIEELESIELVSKKREAEILYDHFELWENGMIAITKNKKQIIIFNNEQKPLYILDVPTKNKDKLNSLFKDASNRIYLLGENYSIQLSITKSSLYHFAPQPISLFNQYIRNLKLVTKNGSYVYRDLGRVKIEMPVTHLKEYTFFNTNISYPKYHNCGTDFIAYQQGKAPELIYSTIDTNSYFAANREFYNYVNGYIAASGSPIDRRWGMQQHSYNTIFSRYKELPLFNYQSNILVFDVFNNKLIHLDHGYKLDTIVDFDLSNTTRNFVALQDVANENIWLFERQKHGSDYLYKLENGLYKSDEGFYIYPFSRNVRLKNNKVYFLDEHYKIQSKALNNSLN